MLLWNSPFQNNKKKKIPFFLEKENSTKEIYKRVKRNYEIGFLSKGHIFYSDFGHSLKKHFHLINW
jgi:precorrin-6B methylase 1